MNVRPATPEDDDAIWRILEPTFRAGETYPIPRDIGRADALAYWHTPGHTVFVAEDDGRVIGTYYLRANNKGGGAHVANAGYITAAAARGRGIARLLCLHSIESMVLIHLFAHLSNQKRRIRPNSESVNISNITEGKKPQRY